MATTSRLRAFGSLGALAAREVHREHEDLFRTYPVRASSVAARLGIKVVLSDAVEGRGRVYMDDGGRDATIHIRKSQAPEYGRFDLAHEIGHVVLQRRFTSQQGAGELVNHERFANAFAAALLLPTRFEDPIKARIGSCRDPSDVLSLASAVGVSVPALFMSLSLHPDWLDVLSGVWLRVKRMAHPHPKGTGGVKLRVEQALFDRRRTFLPLYQGIKSCMSPAEWLESLVVGQSSLTQQVVVKHSVRNSEPSARRYSVVREPMVARAKRLATFHGEYSEVYLLTLVPER